jgi:hypothetical protein
LSVLASVRNEAIEHDLLFRDWTFACIDRRARPFGAGIRPARIVALDFSPESAAIVLRASGAPPASRGNQVNQTDLGSMT